MGEGFWVGHGCEQQKPTFKTLTYIPLKFWLGQLPGILYIHKGIDQKSWEPKGPKALLRDY